MSNNIKQLTYFTVGVLVGLGIFFSYTHFSKNQITMLGPIRQKNTNYQFIKPLLSCDFGGTEQIGFDNLNKKVRSLITDKKTEGKIDRASVYFRTLDKVGRIGINEDESYDPASLLKVIILIAVYKKLEIAPSVEQQQLVFTKEYDKLEATDAESGLVVGNSYSVKELAEKMIVDSDNGAKNLLLSILDPYSIVEVYDALDLPRPTNSNNYATSPHVYSFLFRLMYNATYLNQDFSEQVLHLLSQAKFNDGLVAGLPAGTVTAHKFGEYVKNDAQGRRLAVELHDCGIIYYPGSPYFLCVMTEGKNLQGLQEVIAEISKTIYQDYSEIKP